MLHKLPYKTFNLFLFLFFSRFTICSLRFIQFLMWEFEIYMEIAIVLHDGITWLFWEDGRANALNINLSCFRGGVIRAYRGVKWDVSIGACILPPFFTREWIHLTTHLTYARFCYKKNILRKGTKLHIYCRGPFKAPFWCNLWRAGVYGQFYPGIKVSVTYKS